MRYLKESLLVLKPEHMSVKLVQENVREIISILQDVQNQCFFDHTYDQATYHGFIQVLADYEWQTGNSYLNQMYRIALQAIKSVNPDCVQWADV